jgi:hypothetical protein
MSGCASRDDDANAVFVVGRGVEVNDDKKGRRAKMGRRIAPDAVDRKASAAIGEIARALLENRAGAAIETVSTESRTMQVLTHSRYSERPLSGRGCNASAGYKPASPRTRTPTALGDAPERLRGEPDNSPAAMSAWRRAEDRSRRARAER